MRQFLIWQDFATYRGLGFTSHRHSHFFSQISIPDTGNVVLRNRSGEWQNYQVAFIPSGSSHEMQQTKSNLTLIYMNPLTIGASFFADRTLKKDQAAIEIADLIPADLRIQIRKMLATPQKIVRQEILELFRGFSKTPATRKIDARILKSLGHIEEEFFVLNQLAAEANLSVSRFRHLFKEETGFAFSVYRLWLKTQKAVKHLALRPELISAAYEGGFADQAHFSRIFRRSFGMNPSEFTKKENPFRAIFFAD